jgi:hypothetical protein
MSFAARSATQVIRNLMCLPYLNFQDVVYLLSLFVSLTPKVSVPCQPVSLASATMLELSRIQRGSPATRAFANVRS